METKNEKQRLTLLDRIKQRKTLSGFEQGIEAFYLIKAFPANEEEILETLCPYTDANSLLSFSIMSGRCTKVIPIDKNQSSPEFIERVNFLLNCRRLKHGQSLLETSETKSTTEAEGETEEAGKLFHRELETLRRIYNNTVPDSGACSSSQLIQFLEENYDKEMLKALRTEKALSPLLKFYIAAKTEMELKAITTDLEKCAIEELTEEIKMEAHSSDYLAWLVLLFDKIVPAHEKYLNSENRLFVAAAHVRMGTIETGIKTAIETEDDNLRKDLKRCKRVMGRITRYVEHLEEKQKEEANG